MRTTRDALDRLMRSAARVPSREAGSVPAVLTSQVLTARRAALSGGTDWLLALGWLRRGLALACALTTLVVVLNLSSVVSPAWDDLESWDALVEVTWVP